LVDRSVVLRDAFVRREDGVSSVGKVEEIEVVVPSTPQTRQQTETTIPCDARDRANARVRRDQVDRSCRDVDDERVARCRVAPVRIDVDLRAVVAPGIECVVVAAALGQATQPCAVRPYDEDLCVQSTPGAIVIAIHSLPAAGDHSGATTGSMPSVTMRGHPPSAGTT
jgi:hypothetical protein